MVMLLGLTTRGVAAVVAHPIVRHSRVAQSTSDGLTISGVQLGKSDSDGMGLVLAGDGSSIRGWYFSGLYLDK